MQSIWSPSVANGEVFVRAAAHAAWPKAQPCWWMKCYPISPCANGCSAYPFRSGFYLPASQPKIMGKALCIVYRTIAHRLARYLERQGLLERDAEHSYLTLENSHEDPMDQLRGHSITYRIAM